VDFYDLRYRALAPLTLFGATLFAVRLSRSRTRVEQELLAREAAQTELARLNASLVAAGRHGGRVGAEGRPGAGATFWVALPG
jgi:hypothetical protein